MKSLSVVIIEDEAPATERLERLLLKYDHNTKVVTRLDSVSSAVEFFQERNDFDLIFMDIQLGDGLSLDIFEKVPITKPIIFVTAYDEYALKAFKVNSIDYLLKPIDYEDLVKAIDQFHNIKKEYNPSISSLESIFGLGPSEKKKERFLVKKGSGLRIIPTNQVAYFYSEDGYLHIMDKDGLRHIIDDTLDRLYTQLDHKVFFKVNRKMIVSIPAISKIESYFNSRLCLHLDPVAPHQVIVSREKCREFKAWLG